jgi:hypothetical protein
MQFWLVSLSPLPTMVVVLLLMRWHVLWHLGWQECLGMHHQGDIHWTRWTTLTYPLAATSVGVIAGLLGLGGGSVMVGVAFAGVVVVDAGTGF